MAKPTKAVVALKMAEPLVRQHAPEIQGYGHTIKMPIRRWRTSSGGSTSISRSRSRAAHTLMEASVGYGALLTRIPTIEDVLNEHATTLRDDLLGYRNHVYRIVNLCVAIAG
jgi:hypothetical protein